MSVLKQDKSLVYGLTGELTALVQADANEAQLRAAADKANLEKIESEESTRGSEITRVEGIISSNKNISVSVDKDLQSNIDGLESTINLNKAAAETAINLVQSNLDSEIKDTNKDVSDLNDRVDNVLSNVDDAALDSLSEVVTSFQEADGNLNKAITDLAALRTSKMIEYKEESDAKNALQDKETVRVENKVDTEVSRLDKGLASEVSRAQKEEALKVAIAANLSDLANISVARTNIDVYSKDEVIAAIKTGGSVLATEMVTVSNDKIVFTEAPKGGRVLNFMTVRHIDTESRVWDIQVTLDAGDASGKTFNVHADTAGQFDGKSVMGQYDYNMA